MTSVHHSGAVASMHIQKSLVLKHKVKAGKRPDLVRTGGAGVH